MARTFPLSLVTCLALTAFSIVAVSEESPEPEPPQVHVKLLRAEKLDVAKGEQPMTASIIEVIIDPGAESPPHRHPGFLTGYVLEGTYQFAVANEPVQTLQAGETFFEPAMILHRVSRNPDAKQRTRLVVTMVHPSDAKRLTIPEPQE